MFANCIHNYQLRTKGHWKFYRRSKQLFSTNTLRKLYSTVQQNDNSILNKNKYGGTYKSAAIATDSHYSAEICEEILKQGGTAVDASIAALFCSGVVHPQSVSISGGGFMNVYDSKKKKFLVYDYRPTSPAAFRVDTSTPRFGEEMELKYERGGYAVGVPGEVRGLRLAWENHGRLPWSRLVQPSIDLARCGVELSERGAEALYLSPKDNHILMNDAGLREFLCNGEGGFKRYGDILMSESYAKTLEIIRDYPDDLYTGKLAELYVEDVYQHGGVITMEDMRNYTVKVSHGLTFELNGLKFCTTSAPGGGSILAHAINVLKGYDFSETDLKDEHRLMTMTHRYIEAMKFALSHRAYIGDIEANPPNLQQKIKESQQGALDDNLAEINRLKIDDNKTHEQSYYTDAIIDHMEYGTTHVSCIDKDGNAVSASESIDMWYGAGFRSLKTGIIFNNAIIDFFEVNNRNKMFTSSEHSPNWPGPNKRPYSSMSPTIGIDQHGAVRLVLGAAGGQFIQPALVWMLLLNQMCNLDLQKAMRIPRLLPDLYTNLVYNETMCSISKQFEDDMIKRGHVIQHGGLTAVVQAVSRCYDNSLHAQADFRKKGATGGY